MALIIIYLAWVAVEYGQAGWNTIKGWYSGLAPHMCISMAYSGVINFGSLQGWMTQKIIVSATSNLCVRTFCVYYFTV